VGGELEPTINLSPAVTLDAYGVTTLLERFSEYRDTSAQILTARIRKEWRFRRSGQDYLTLRLTNNELELIRQAGGVTRPKLVSYQYLAVYRHKESGQEVTLRSTDRPPVKRAFRTPSHGRKRFKRVKLFRIIQTKENEVPTKSKKKNKKGKAAPETDDDELEGLEELEELEEEEPDDDEESDEEEDEDEDEAPKKRTRKTKSKKSKSKKAKADDDEEDEDEEETPRKKQKKGAKKGGKKSKGGGKNAKSPGQTTKEMTGGVGSAELAEAASEIAETEITGRDVRVYLRKNEIAKNEEHGRYVWPSTSNKSFVKLAKAIAAEYEDDE
jgi:hypothetical protein